MSHTTDRDDPRLTHGVDDAPVEQAAAYLVLSDEERAKGFVRPVRQAYVHAEGEDPCDVMTTMSMPIAETYARLPTFYGATYCAGCRMHLAVSEFRWVPNPGETIDHEHRLVGS